MNPLLPASAQSDLVLASRSPRRGDLMRGLGFEFRTEVSAYLEDSFPGEAPEAMVRRHALGKAREVAGRLDSGLVIGADTIVVCDEPLGKPADADEARAMLTAVALLQAAGGGSVCALGRTRVDFRELDPGEINAYISSGEAFDKAGAYGIQGLAAAFVTGIDGCYFNVMGLPLELLCRLLRAFANGDDLAPPG